MINAPKLLFFLVLFDTIASYVFWSNEWMEEANPIMLWALQHGWVYWAFKGVQLILVAWLFTHFKSKRMVRLANWILIFVFAAVWIQFFIGSVV